LFADGATGLVVHYSGSLFQHLLKALFAHTQVIARICYDIHRLSEANYAGV